MNEFLRKFDTIRFFAPWSIFKNFLRIFHFLNLNLNFEFWPVGYRPKPEPARTGLTGNRSNRTGSHRFGEPWWGETGTGTAWLPRRLVQTNQPTNLALLPTARSAGSLGTRNPPEKSIRSRRSIGSDRSSWACARGSAAVSQSVWVT